MSNVKKIGLCLLSIVLLMNGQSLRAEVPDTDASITITEGTGPTSPVDPEDLGNIGEGGVEGSLAIVSVSDFIFAEATATLEAGSYAIATTRPNIQIVDLRGQATGWTLRATVSPFMHNNEPSLRGATIHISDGRPNSLVSAVFAPEQLPVELTTDENSADVIKAYAGKGMGLWVMRWYPDREEGEGEGGEGEEEEEPYILLNIPAGVATVGTHTATINWSLHNTP